MAKETITLKVAPENEQSTIETYSAFGWELITSQQIYNQDSHLEAKDEKLYSVTETTNFVRIVLSRDRNIPNYAKLCDLQNQFESIYTLPPNLYNGMKKFSLFLLGIGVILFILSLSFLRDTGNVVPGAIMIVLSVLFAILAVTLLIIYTKKGSANARQYDKNKQKADSERAKILNEAWSLSR